MANQIPNLNSLMGQNVGQAAPMMPGGGMLSAMPGYQQPTGNMQIGQSRPPPPGGWADPYGMNQQQQMMGQMGGPQMGRPMAPQMAQMGSTQTANHVVGDDAATDTTAGKGWWDTFGEIDWGTGLATAGTIAGALDSAKNTTKTGHAMQDYLTSLGDTLNDGSQFQGYGVSTGLGNGSVKYDDNGQLITDLGLDADTQTQITNMQNASTGNFTDAANAYNAMNAVNSGQSSTDFNAMSGTLQGAANGITPGQGAAGGFFGSQMEASQGMAPGQGAFGGQAQDAASRAMADPSQRQGEIYQQMMAMQNPELNRQQGEQQAQEYARGRGGVRGSQYGGTAEDAAMARARANASNQASLNAMQQADSERNTFGQMASQFGQLGNQNYANESNQQSNLANSAAQMGQIGNQNYANMGNYANQLNNSAAAFGGLGNQADSNAIQKMGMLGTMGNQLAQLGQQNYQNSFMPMQQQLAAMDLGMKNANMAQTGQLTGQDYMAQLGLGGANANINAQHSANQLTGNLYNALLSNIGGVQGSDGTAGSGLMGILGDTLGTMFGFGE